MLAAGVLALLAGCREPPAEPAAPASRASSLAEVLGGPTDGYAVADPALELRFPRDHGPHPAFRSEWWYLTGNLAAPDRELGYQLTIFRSALAPTAPELESAWATNQVYMGHLAVGDLTAGRFRAFDRFARAALGLAGAELDPLRVWIEDWELAVDLEGGVPGADALDGLLPLRVRAADDGVALELRLRRDRPLVLQGEGGFSRKGARPENASHYYSVTRLQTEGTVVLDGVRHEVVGSSWLDREWSTSALEPGQVGWDWFALQLAGEQESGGAPEGDAGLDLMLYALRRADGSVDPHSAGIAVGANGVLARLGADAFTIEVLDRWRSPRTGVLYPSRWRLRVPELAVDLEVEPRIADQELDLAFRYWEGAVRASGRARGAPVAGVGFVELTGYEPEP